MVLVLGAMRGRMLPGPGKPDRHERVVGHAVVAFGVRITAVLQPVDHLSRPERVVEAIRVRPALPGVLACIGAVV